MTGRYATRPTESETAENLRRPRRPARMRRPYAAPWPPATTTRGYHLLRETTLADLNEVSIRIPKVRPLLMAEVLRLCQELDTEI